MNPETSTFLLFLALSCGIPTVLLIVACGIAAAMRSSQISQERGE